MASATMPWSSQISIVRQWMPIALSAWVEACARFSTTRTAIPRRASSIAWVSPAGPAPTTSTSAAGATPRGALVTVTGTGSGAGPVSGFSTNSCTDALGTGAAATGSGTGSTTTGGGTVAGCTCGARTGASGTVSNDPSGVEAAAQASLRCSGGR